MFLVDVLCGLLRPAVCLACGAPAAWPCCAHCLPAQPDDVGPWPLAADPDVTLWALGPYRDALRAALLAGKLDGQPAALTELGRRLGTALAIAGVGADLVTYVAAARVAGPPRDHAERVAAGVAAALDLPLVTLLAPAGGPDLGRARRAARFDRPPFDRSPSDRSRSDRRPSVRVPPSRLPPSHPPPSRPPPTRPPPTARRRLAGGRVLLVDDLATTGGTLAGAAATLRHAGAHQVEAAVLAAAPTALGAGPAPQAAHRPRTTRPPPGPPNPVRAHPRAPPGPVARSSRPCQPPGPAHPPVCQPSDPGALGPGHPRDPPAPRARRRFGSPAPGPGAPPAAPIPGRAHPGTAHPGSAAIQPSVRSSTPWPPPGWPGCAGLARSTVPWAGCPGCRDVGL